MPQAAFKMPKKRPLISPGLQHLSVTANLMADWYSGLSAHLIFAHALKYYLKGNYPTPSPPLSGLGILSMHKQPDLVQ